jgi:hypothetical protein
MKDNSYVDRNAKKFDELLRHNKVRKCYEMALAVMY